VRPIVPETVYSSHSELHHPLRFVTAAVSELRRSPAVAWRLFRSNVQARHRRAWLGYLWLLLPTLGTTAVWVYVKSRGIVSLAATDVPYPVYVLSGMIFWQVFADALSAPLQQLAAGRQMITRSRLPHEALILAGLFELLLNCAVRLLVLAAVMVAFRVPITPAIALVPIGIAAIALFGLALGLAVAPVGLLYDDVPRAITLVTGLWFFVTPILYPARGAMRWNPLTPLIESTRGWLTGSVADRAFPLVVAATIPVLVAAWLLFRLARPHVVARLG
jgi:lipopolysaccharide transport system permease protein